MSRYVQTNREKLAGGTLPDRREDHTATVEDYLWLIGTHHRDFDDLQVYKTTKVYIMKVQKVPYIVADRVIRLKSGRYSGKSGDCSGIHVRDIEQYTRAYREEVDALMTSEHLLSTSVCMDTACGDDTIALD